MNAIELLETQHEEVKSLFDRIEKANGEARRQLFEEIADHLAVHSAIEEKHFYPATRAARTEELLQQAVEEHLSVKRIVADLLEMDPGEAQFDFDREVKEARANYPELRKKFGFGDDLKLPGEEAPQKK